MINVYKIQKRSTVVSGQWTVDSEQWTVDSEQWTVDSEPNLALLMSVIF